MKYFLKEKREEKNMSQNELASMTGVSRQMIGAIENGERNPSVETAKAIAKALDFEWTSFFENKD